MPPSPERAVKRFRCADFHEPSEVTFISDEYGEWVRYSDHASATSDLEHRANFWAWRYERREAECEELAELIRGAAAWCQDNADGIEEGDREGDPLSAQLSGQMFAFREAASYLRSLQTNQGELQTDPNSSKGLELEDES